MMMMNDLTFASKFIIQVTSELVYVIATYPRWCRDWFNVTDRNKEIFVPIIRTIYT